MFGEMAGWLIMLGAWVVLLLCCLIASTRIINRNDNTGDDNDN